jgi:endo-1,4-beta-xylanase
VPIDGVGLQMHITAGNRPSDEDITANIRRLTALGLIVHISEMDVRINNVPGSEEARLELQRTTYRDVVRVCMAERRCQAITFWGFTDAHTWLSGDRPLLFDAQYMPKPAYYAFSTHCAADKWATDPRGSPAEARATHARRSRIGITTGQ